MHRYLAGSMAVQVSAMGLFRDWIDSGGETFAPGGRAAAAGEADSNRRPWHARGGQGDWPTIVFEAGFSQSLPSLRAKMRWWFQASGHQVQVVVLAKAFPGGLDKHIQIEAWQEQTPTPSDTARPGATRTRSLAAGGPEPTCRQTVHASWGGPVPFRDATADQIGDPQSYHVARAPLV